MISLFFFALDLLLLTYLAGGALYQLFFSLAGLFYKNPFDAAAPMTEKTRMAVFIPAYREDRVIVETARAACRHDYPADRFAVVVIADGLQASTRQCLAELPLRLIEVQFEKSTKSRALNAALRHLEMADERFDMAVVLDADNQMVPGFLHRMAAARALGWKAVQGRRAAKNEHNGIALLDGASEDVNNHILGRGHQALGLSARLAGSGMAFDYALFARTMSAVDAVGGFDKELELRLTRQGIRIGYDEEAAVLDEKVSRPATFSRQRSRWIAAQWHYAWCFLPAGGYSLLTEGRVDFFNKSLQMTLPPRLLLPVLLLVGVLVHGAAGHDLLPWWSISLLASLLSFAVALPSRYFRLQHIGLWLSVPTLVWSTLAALFRIREAGQHFLHTPKEITSV